MDYIYKGDKQTAAELKNQTCRAVKRHDGKCVRSRKGSMLVEFQNGSKHVVVARMLRKVLRTAT